MRYEMPAAEVRDRLERIKNYNTYHLRAGQPMRCMTEKKLASILEEWGTDQNRAKGVGWVPPPSPFLKNEQEGEF